MRIIAQASQCRVCGKITSPPKGACSCWNDNRNFDEEYRRGEHVLYGVLVRTEEGKQFYSVSEISDLLRDGVEVLTEDGQHLRPEALPDDC